MNKEAISVSKLNSYIKKVLENDIELSNIYIRGEISNYKYHSSGHMYFTLKDESSKIKCVMFRSYNSALKFRPEDGMNVIVRASVSLYERDGQYQLYCNKMEPDGIGSLYLAYEQLKAKLNSEGVFDEKTKKSLPEVAFKIGVATSPTGAVIKDIINVATNRYHNINILLYPVKVQGDGAELSIIEGIEYFNSRNDIDVIIIGRGGGSIEELWAFNSEKLAYSIRASRIPIISAVGHETDFTIADFAADIRASTPSHAAELCTLSYTNLKYRISTKINAIEESMNNYIKNSRYVINVSSSLLEKNSPINKVTRQMQYVDFINSQINNRIKNIITQKKSTLMLIISTIDGLSPLKILTRGYAFVEKNDKVVSSVKAINVNDMLKIRMYDGHANCKVINIKENEVW